MNYQEIVDAAIAYSDKQDIGITNNIDVFLRIVEARVNDRMKMRRMSKRCTIETSVDQQYYGLPPDFDGLRDIEIDGSTLEYLAPIHMNSALRVSPGETFNGEGSFAYTIIADQLQIYPATDKTLEIVYYANLNPLSTIEPSNWLSRENPNIYVFGLLVEISAFVKDPEAANLWDTRFLTEIDVSQTNDDSTRWSGTPLQIKVG